MSKLRSLVPSTHSLFVFEAAARNLSFKGAAAELNVTQPSVSHAIKMFEKRCGTHLFVRDNRGVQLTEAGRQLYEEVRTSFRRMEQKLEAISDRGTKYITFAASSSMAAHWLAPQLYHFQEDHPDIKIKVVSTDRDIEPDQEIDVTVWVRPRDFKRLNSWFVCDEIIFPVCSPSYLQEHPTLKTIDDLTRHQLLHSSDAYRKRMSWNEWIELAGGDASEIKPNIVFNDYQLTLQAALAGEGISLGWNLTAQYLLANRLLVRPIEAKIQTDRASFILTSDEIGKNQGTKILVDWFLNQAQLLGL
ncbi:LysR family transcriptional regulator [Mesorhizobium sp. M1E.F.Ca.ET.045.02.1.1]|uniref:LysR substrate-binding domain-containing protein n=1 Tax=unclassified Mesorhizobium TaxID=325217 RepID=UPI000F7574B9|nr:MULTISPECIES: LysR substrate-binding domain-containing protein [unclassified Mesorhizobium]AZO21582.1 LysR family transcriptional regulator [Mesorhizobium sp. M1E.F.Ca.ET.045.02.1.1]RUW85520.1 LysR family transcriptional regulator [Mesorhizobium sp. M1E.F.Ca.ET.063.01.1.1]